jgi:hypothetical protein
LAATAAATTTAAAAAAGALSISRAGAREGGNEDQSTDFHKLIPSWVDWP